MTAERSWTRGATAHAAPSSLLAGLATLLLLAATGCGSSKQTSTGTVGGSQDSTTAGDTAAGATGSTGDTATSGDTAGPDCTPAADAGCYAGADCDTPGQHCGAFSGCPAATGYYCCSMDGGPLRYQDGCTAPEPTCGAEGLPCCSGSECDSPFICVGDAGAGTCARCGLEGDVCCPASAGRPCGGGLTCSADGRCTQPDCGIRGLPCCAGNVCDPYSVSFCATDAGDPGTCVACGGEGEVCCPGSAIPSPCGGGLICASDGGAASCVPCGAEGKPCCEAPSNPCDAPLACGPDDTCRPPVGTSTGATSGSTG